MDICHGESQESLKFRKRRVIGFWVLAYRVLLGFGYWVIESYLDIGYWLYRTTGAWGVSPRTKIEKR